MSREDTKSQRINENSNNNKKEFSFLNAPPAFHSVNPGLGRDHVGAHELWDVGSGPWLSRVAHSMDVES